MKNPIVRIAASLLLLWTVADFAYRAGQASILSKVDVQVGPGHDGVLGVRWVTTKR